MHPLLRLSCMFVGLAIAPLAKAWGPAGHQAVGAIADQLIAGTHAATRVRSILGTTLQSASVWADCAKGVQQKNGVYSYATAGQYAECKLYERPASEALLVDFVKRNATRCTSNASDEQCRHKAYHYTDVAELHDHYDHQYAGTSDHDIVSAIDACIAVLQGHAAPAPFNIKNKKEALRLLSHYVGDIHQPLHVAAIYLDATGHEIDPDAGSYDPATATRGGNSIKDGSQNLHAEWDGIPTSLATKLRAPAGVAEARQTPLTAGSPETWATQWASETIVQGKAAFAGLQFSPQASDHTWPATHPASYAKNRQALQRAQLLKAGARLAQILQTLWP